MSKTPFQLAPGENPFDEESGTGYKWNTKYRRYDYYENNKYKEPLGTTLKWLGRQGTRIGGAIWGKVLEPSLNAIIEGQTLQAEQDIIRGQALVNTSKVIANETANIKENIGDAITTGQTPGVTIRTEKKRNEKEINSYIDQILAEEDDLLLHENNERAREF